MSSNCHLFANDSNEPIDDWSSVDEESMLGMNYMMPLYWFALFDTSCIKYRGDEKEPIFITSVDEGRKRYENRKNILKSRLGDQTQNINQFFDSYLQSLNKKYIHLETYEIGSMSSSAEEWEEELKKVFRVFEPVEVEKQEEKKNIFGFKTKKESPQEQEWQSFESMYQQPLNSETDILLEYFLGVGECQTMPWESEQ